MTTIKDHLRELKRRISYIIIFWIGFTLLAFIWRNTLLTYVTSFYGPLVFFSPLEGFSALFYLASWTSVFCTLPFALYHIWQFIAPGLTAKEKTTGKLFAYAIPILFLVGSILGYTVILPQALTFFLEFSSSVLSFTPHVEPCLGFMLRIMIITGLAFQFPLLIIGLYHMNKVSSVSLKKHRRFWILGIVISAALLTPPDAFTQLLLALPLLILYEGAVAYVILHERMNHA